MDLLSGKMHCPFAPPRPNAEEVVTESEELIAKQKDLRTYSDSYLYSKYPEYNKKLFAAIMNDPVIDKSTDNFQNVVYEVTRTRVSEAIVRILTSTNTVLLDCESPLPKAFKVFCARDMRTAAKQIKVFIDCSSIITKNKTNMGYTVDEMKLVSYLVDAAVCMIYHRKFDTIARNRALIYSAATCFAKCFTFIVDYLVKVSIQESSKSKSLYLSAMYFLEGILNFSHSHAMEMACKIAEVSSREAEMINILVEKASTVPGVSNKDTNPYDDLRRFINIVRDVLKLNRKSFTIDIVVDRWLQHYGVSTILALEYFPAFSAMMTDCYNGAFINHQRAIETVCKVDMINYSKAVLNMIDHTI